MKKFYTRTGDDGTTGLLGEERVEKFDLRMEALGALDELSATLGIVRSQLKTEDERLKIITLQRKLYELMAEVAASPENAQKFQRITVDAIVEIETEIDRISMQVDVPEGFIVPGETQASAFISMARTISRRAERRVAELLSRGDLKNEQVLRYLNRLSSLLFVMELEQIQKETQHKPTMAREKKS